MTEDCVFCKIVRGELPANKIYENDAFVSFYSIDQKISGHCLVIPKHHATTLLDMPSTGGTELLDCIKHTALLVLEKEGAGGFNLAQNNGEVAGQVVPHVHFHILPRKKGSKAVTVH